MKRRIYTDTSVIGGVLDVEFTQSSQILMDTFRHGEATLVISNLTELELLSAPSGVQATLAQVPEVHRERVEMTEEALGKV